MSSRFQQFRDPSLLGFYFSANFVIHVVVVWLSWNFIQGSDGRLIPFSSFASFYFQLAGAILFTMIVTLLFSFVGEKLVTFLNLDRFEEHGPEGRGLFENHSALAAGMMGLQIMCGLLSVIYCAESIRGEFESLFRFILAIYSTILGLGIVWTGLYYLSQYVLSHRWK